MCESDSPQGGRCCGTFGVPMTSDTAALPSLARADHDTHRRRDRSRRRGVAAALLTATVLIALLQVFCRYVLNDSLSWPEEMAKFAFVWFVFLGAAMVTRRSRHIVIDLVPRSLGPRSCASMRSWCG